MFHLKAPWGTFPFYLSDVAGLIVNPKVFAAGTDEAHGLAPTGAGAGAYEVTRFVAGRGDHAPAQEGLVGRPGVHRHHPGDRHPDRTPRRFDALKLGEIDIEFERAPRRPSPRSAKAGFGHYFELSHAGSILMVYSR